MTLPIPKSTPAWLVTAGLFLQANLAGGALLYQDSFEAGDPVDYVPVTGATTSGLPDIVGPELPLISSSARFSTVGNQPSFFYDQAGYSIPTEARAVSLQFDVMFSDFVGASDLQFTVFFDAPNVNYLQFRSDGVLFATGLHTGAFTNDSVMHVSVLFDEVSGQWTSLVDGVPFNTSAIYAPAGLDLRQIRFAMGFKTGKFSADPLANVYVDNVMISTVPVPGGLALFGSALAVLACWRHRGQGAGTPRPGGLPASGASILAPS